MSNTLRGSDVLLGWAAGSMVFLWVTTRHRIVSPGYGWLMRSIFLSLLVWSLATRPADPILAVVATSFAILSTLGGLVISVSRRDRIVDHAKARRRAKVLAMAGSIESELVEIPVNSELRTRHWPARLDLSAAAFGLVALVSIGFSNGSPMLSALRLVSGALFVGAVTDSMLLGHWYLVQPGLKRAPIVELVDWALVLTPLHVAVWLIPTGMFSVMTGTVDDGWAGLLFWTWATAGVTTFGLLWVARKALQERFYSAVMAATGLTYLAILTAAGTDLIARAVLSS